MKRFLTIAVIAIVFAAVSFFGISLFRGPSPVITYDGSMQIEIGESNLQVLFDGGFSGSTGSLARNAWEEYGVVKNGVRFGNVFIKNSASSPTLKSKCKIFGALIKFDNSKERGEVLVNGINFQGSTVDKVKELMSDYKLTSETKTTLQFKKGAYYYTIKFDRNGTVENINIKDDTKTVG